MAGETNEADGASFQAKGPGAVEAELRGTPELRNAPEQTLDDRLDYTRLYEVALQAADVQIMQRYIAIGVAEFLGTMTAEELRQYEDDHFPPANLSAHGRWDETGRHAGFDVYHIDPQQRDAKQDEVSQIAAESDRLYAGLGSAVEDARIQILNEEVQAGRAEDLGELDDEQFSDYIASHPGSEREGRLYNEHVYDDQGRMIQGRRHSFLVREQI